MEALKGLFSGVLEELDAGSIDRVGVMNGPTNHEIIEATKAAYARHQKPWDGFTERGREHRFSSRGLDRVEALHAHQWHRGANPPPVMTEIRNDGIWKQPIADAEQQLLTTVTLGICVGARIFIGADGKLGAAFDTVGRERTRGLAWIGASFGLDLDASLMLYAGAWNVLPSELQLPAPAQYFGLTVGVTIVPGVVARAWVYFKDEGRQKPVQFRGFDIGIGIGVTGGASIIQGKMSTF